MCPCHSSRKTLDRAAPQRRRLSHVKGSTSSPAKLLSNGARTQGLMPRPFQCPGARRGVMKTKAARGHHSSTPGGCRQGIRAAPGPERVGDPGAQTPLPGRGPEGTKPMQERTQGNPQNARRSKWVIMEGGSQGGGRASGPPLDGCRKGDRASLVGGDVPRVPSMLPVPPVSKYVHLRPTWQHTHNDFADCRETTP